MANQDTSIGTDGDQPVDGIAGTNPGTQQPDGAHIDAGGAKGGHEAEVRQPAAGGNHQGITQPAGVTGVMGTRRALQPGELSQLVQAGKINGSLARAGKTIGVRIGCGAIGK